MLAYTHDGDLCLLWLSLPWQAAEAARRMAEAEARHAEEGEAQRDEAQAAHAAALDELRASNEEASTALSTEVEAMRGALATLQARPDVRVGARVRAGLSTSNP